MKRPTRCGRAIGLMAAGCAALASAVALPTMANAAGEPGSATIRPQNSSHQGGYLNSYTSAAPATFQLVLR